MSENELFNRAALDAKFPVGHFTATFVMGWLFVLVSVMAYLEHGSGWPLLIASPMALCGLALWWTSLQAVADHMGPLNETQLSVIRDFPFNKPSEEFLRGVVAKRGTVRPIDLSKALKLHQKHKNDLKSAQVDELRKEALQRFISQP